MLVAVDAGGNRIEAQREQSAGELWQVSLTRDSGEWSESFYVPGGYGEMGSAYRHPPKTLRYVQLRRCIPELTLDERQRPRFKIFETTKAEHE